MADGPALALQAALVAALKADAAVAALVGARVYDQPPQKPDHPYIRIGDLDVRPFRDDGFRAWDIGFAIEVYHRPVAGRVETTRIADAVIALLDETPSAVTVAGFRLPWLDLVTSVVTRSQADGRSYEARIVFETNLEQ